ncbi:M13 family metallopeptidase [Limibacter armeniacum]|uniref:M13 family metallopeptidase n=1 Tax=Limibacter armeniacum TaxID=466084 RepID=UPI002FE57A9F
MASKTKWLKYPGMAAVAAVLFATSCGSPASDQKEEELTSALKLVNMDTTVSPSDNFFMYVNGGWMKHTTIPADRGRWGSFDELRDANETVTLDVLKRASDSPKFAEDSDERKAAKFYASGMDSVNIEEAGIKPVEPLLQKVDNLSNKDGLQDLITELHQYGTRVFFAPYAYQDMKNSELISLYIAPTGIGLPNKDFYTKQDDRSKEVRELYKEHIAKMFVLAGYNAEEAKTASHKVFELEDKLAQGFMTPVERRDPTKRYNPRTLDALQEEMSAIEWKKYFEATPGLETKPENVVLTNNQYFALANEVLENTPVDVIKDYIKWHILHESAAYLSSDFVNENFAFYGKELNGLEQLRPRWKRVLGATNSSLGFALGKLYVDEVFPPEAKEKAQEMVADIKEAFGRRINGLEWMTDETKQKAMEKLDSFNVKIGYPDKWKTYENLEVTDSYFTNVLNSSKFEVNRNLEKFGKPVDKTEWGMTPQTVNAYYNPSYNEIVFPAAILQPPFYNYKADDAVNYGGIGAVIGHEITHGFDDSGRRYDAKGQMTDWWTAEDNEKFKERANQVVEQFNSYEPIKGLNVNGQLTLGENIADLGGLSVAYDALQHRYEKEGRPANIDGFTPEQRFFMSWATIWRTKSREAALRNQILTDPHSPGQYRANGPLSNMDAFYKAFNIQEGDSMRRENRFRAKIW